MENEKMFGDFLKDDLEGIIEEARLTACRNIKDRLVMSFENYFWEEAQKRLAGISLGKETLEQELENGLVNELAKDFENQLANKNEEDNVFLEEIEKAQIISENQNIYLFGITHAEAAGFINLSHIEGMVNGDPVYSVPHKDLLAVVCRVPHEEFNELKIQELIENRDWLEEKAEQHRRVVSILAQNYPIIPMRFSSLYPAHHQLKIFIEENYSELVSLLSKIQDKSEWGLKLYLDLDSFKNFLRKKDECINKLMDEVLLNHNGKGYFPKKKLAYCIERKAFDFAEEVHRRLCRVSQGTVLKKLSSKKNTEKNEQMILNGAYLVAKGQEEEFVKLVKWLEGIEAPRGFVFEISGPRPCYNFCHISSNAT